MPRSSSLFLFPDVNVWLALSYQRHTHYSSAQAWFQQLDEEARVCFCRLTQISLLRLLTTDAVMGQEEVLSQVEAWLVYDRWFADDRVLFLEEPPGLEARFRAFSNQRRATPKDWADSYLSAFAQSTGIRLVTFDRALGAKSGGLLI